MDLHVISIFPDMFKAITEQGVVGRAISNEVLSLSVHNPRDFAEDKHRRVDDRPFGGGPGMVMKPQPLVDALAHAQSCIRQTSLENSDEADLDKPMVVYLSPQGQRFDHAKALEVSAKRSLVLIAGRYEGIDERVVERYVDEEWSVGDYVLSGGELPAMVVIDALTRLLPASLGNSESAEQDSFASGLLDCPHYTRPEKFDDVSVPSVLLGGDHQAIERWRMKQALGRTWLRRPELLNKIDLTDEQFRLLEEFKSDLLTSTSSSHVARVLKRTGGD